MIEFEVRYFHHKFPSLCPCHVSQFGALKIILKDDYKTYENALRLLDLEKLCERRENLCLKYAKKCIKHPKMKDLFPLRKKKHGMITRNQEIFQVEDAHTKRLQDSPVIYMQKMLNQASSEFLCLQPKL